MRQGFAFGLVSAAVSSRWYDVSVRVVITNDIHHDSHGQVCRILALI